MQRVKELRLLKLSLADSLREVGAPYNNACTFLPACDQKGYECRSVQDAMLAWHRLAWSTAVHLKHT